MLQIKQTGLRYGDTCSIITPMKPKRSVPLNRTKWDIVPDGDEERNGVPLIQVPGAKTKSFRWRLELVPVAGDARFLLRSLDNSAFTLNGQWTREAYLEGQDTLGLQTPGRIEFNREVPQDALLSPQWPATLKDPRVLSSTLPILLQGETGTGKSHIAREIHQRSARLGSFVSLNVSALSPSLVESELFGHRKGSFTGATTDRKGALAEAHHGTLFLDEVDSLSRDMQVKLLLFLDRGFYRAVGASREERSMTRLIFASGRPLDQLVKTAEMRADFYYRLCQGVMVELTPLRESPEDIIRHCQMFAIENRVVIGEKLMEFYRSLPWPGNVRQLRGHLMAKKVRSKTRKFDFDEWDDKLLKMTSNLEGIALSYAPIKTMEEVKREYARQTLMRCHGELTLTARELGVNPKTLRGWLQN